MHRERKHEKPAAYIVTCGVGKVTFKIGLKSMKNTESICSHCPLRRHCSKIHRYSRLRLYSILMGNIKGKLPIKVRL